MATLAFGLGWAAAACGSTFACEQDSQCEQDGAAGVCQAATGFCSFPSDDCDSGQQYGELAPDGLAGTCVPSVEDTETPTSTGEPEDTTGGPTPDPDTGTTGSSVDSTTTMSVDPDTSTSDSTGASEGDSSDGGSSDGGSSSGGPMLCCSADCPDACQDDDCAAELIGADPPQNSEAIGVAVVGDQVVWSTGFGRSLMLAEPAMGIDQELVAVPENSFVTRIASDDTDVYFLDWGGSTIRRVSVQNATVDLVSVVPGGEAGFGGIAVDDTHVYFSMRNSGGVWRAAKDLGDQDGAELVAESENPFGVAVDDAHVFFIDNEVGAVLRIALDEAGVDKGGEIVVTAAGLSAIAVDDDGLFYGANGQLSRADKLGTNQGVQNLGAELGNIWNVDLDETHAYYTGSSADTVGRVPKDGSGPVESLVTTNNPWGLALGCDEIYWAENGTQTLQRRLK